MSSHSVNQSELPSVVSPAAGSEGGRGNIPGESASLPSAAKGGGGSVTPEALFERIRRGARCRVVDVRTSAEYAGERVSGSESAPLDELQPASFQGAASEELYLLCQGGGRATRAAQRLLDAGVVGVVIEGGLNAWKSAGLPVEHGGGWLLPVMQQTQLVIGTMSAAGSALALWKHPGFAWIPLFFGLGLMFAGLTGNCGLALLLARMPWNRRGLSGTKGAASSCCSVAPVVSKAVEGR